jgi:hypothetical protein
MAAQVSGENRMLALGLGISVIAVLGAMRYVLIRFRDSMEVELPAPKPQYIDQKTEDALQPSTLEKLVGSHNKDIQGVASRIVLDRALHDDYTLQYLLTEVTKRDAARRERALRALHLICGESNQALIIEDNPMLSSTTGALKDIYISRVIKALAIALRNCADENDYPPYDRDFDMFDFRDPVENVALVTLELLLNERPGATRALVKTNFVRDWLAKQNWGDTDFNRQVNFVHHFRQHMSGRSNPLTHIVSKIAGLKEGVDQLIAANLINGSGMLGIVKFKKGYSIFRGQAGSPRTSWVYGVPRGGNEDELNDDITYSFEEALSNANNDDPTVGGGRRPIEQSAEERRLRRRNREVMVLNDGSQPLTTNDIIDSL